MSGHFPGSRGSKELLEEKSPIKLSIKYAFFKNRIFSQSLSPHDFDLIFLESKRNPDLLN